MTCNYLLFAVNDKPFDDKLVVSDHNESMDL